MDKSPASNPSQRENTQQSSTRPRVRKIPSTPRPEVAAPSILHATVPPIVSTPQPPETSVSESYLQIIKDMMGRFSPAGKMNDLLTHMADEFRKEEANTNPIPLEIPTDPATLTETSAAQTLVEQTTSLIPPPARDPIENYNNQEVEEEDEAEVEGAAEGNSQAEEREGGEGDETEEVEEDVQKEMKEDKQEESANEGKRQAEECESERVEGKETERNEEESDKNVVVLEEEESSDDGRILDERAVRRSMRTARKKEMEGTKEPLEEAASIESKERRAAELKRKGKQIAVPDKKTKPQQASLSVVIQEPT